MNAKDVAIITILLIAGTILQYLISPLRLLLTPDVITAFFCLGIIVIRPKFDEALAIGFAGGFLSMLIPGSIFPWGNLVAGPAGAYACYFFSELLRDKSLSPLITTFVATLVSGFVFVLITTIVIFDTILTRFSNYGDFVMTYLPIIVGTAVLNAIIVQLLFFSSSGDTFGKKAE